jgi:hypothetical protein
VIPLEVVPTEPGGDMDELYGQFTIEDGGDGPPVKRVWELVAGSPPQHDLLVQDVRATAVGVPSGLVIMQTLHRGRSSSATVIDDPVRTALRRSWEYLGSGFYFGTDEIPIDPVDQVPGEAPVPPGLARLIESVLTTLKAKAWSDLRGRLGVPPSVDKPLVFVSYRRGRETFAKAVATRLGREGFLPWFDQWEVQPGDSLPGKIGEGLRKSVAFVPILTADYSAGVWATSEYETALVRALRGGLRIVPIVLEQGEKPPLLEPYVHVDFSDHDAETFERRMGEVIDGINRLEKNPFR